MMELSITDHIWNRAALDSGGASPMEGDQALSDLLLFHGVMMNGGIGHAVNSLDEQEISGALSGYRYFGFDEFASFVESVKDMDEGELEESSPNYASIIPDDDAIERQFIEKYNSSPELFSPI